jgi:lactate permease
VGRESDLFRFTVRHSFLMLLAICIITMLQAYVFTGIIPTYQKGDGSQVAMSNTAGWPYLLILAFALTILLIIIRRSGGNTRSVKS